MYDLIIRNGSIVTEEGVVQGDIVVCRQTIVQIGSIAEGQTAKERLMPAVCMCSRG
jgi:allantoinase